MPTKTTRLSRSQSLLLRGVLAPSGRRGRRPVAYHCDLVRLEIRTPDGILLSEDVTSIRVQLADGWWGILPCHTPFIAELPVGFLIYRRNGERHYVVLAGGTLEVQRDKVLILAPAAERADEIAALKKALEKRKLEEEQAAFHAHIEFERARAALMRALIEEASRR